jgi:hypothetical protein
MELFGVAIVVLLVGITLLVLARSRTDGRARRMGVERRDSDCAVPRSGDGHQAGRR